MWNIIYLRSRCLQYKRAKPRRFDRLRPGILEVMLPMPPRPMRQIRQPSEEAWLILAEGLEPVVFGEGSLAEQREVDRWDRPEPEHGSPRTDRDEDQREGEWSQHVRESHRLEQEPQTARVKGSIPEAVHREQEAPETR